MGDGGHDVLHSSAITVAVLQGWAARPANRRSLRNKPAFFGKGAEDLSAA
jgi:hypothetical protein